MRDRIKVFETLSVKSDDDVGDHPAKSPTIFFNRLTFIGIGLIGSSIARAVREKNLARKIIICDASADVRKRASELELGDEIVDTNIQAVQNADGVIISVPIDKCRDVAADIAAYLKHGAIVSDVCSVKVAAIEDIASQLPPEVHYVPAHPIAGTEKSGPDAGYGQLFKDRCCILTPTKKTASEAVDHIAAFWRAMGSYIAIMSAKEHDLALAVTSHLPHLIAYNMMGTAEDSARFSAGSFADLTRVAASNPSLWTEILLANKAAVIEMLDKFIVEMLIKREWILSDQSEPLLAALRAAQRMRLDLSKK